MKKKRNPGLALVACVAGPLMSSCGSASENLSADPDFAAASPQLCASGGLALRTSSKRELAEPTYLPEWAPIIPNASVKEKALFCANGQPLYVVTTFEVKDSLQDAISFYDRFYEENETPLESTFGREGFKTYTHEKLCRTKNKVTVREQAVSGKEPYTKLTVVFVVPNEHCED